MGRTTTAALLLPPPAAAATMAADDESDKKDKGRQTHQHRQADSVVDAFLMLGADESPNGVEKGADLLHGGSRWGGGMFRPLPLSSVCT